MAFWKESMINRLSNLINRNRSAAKISQVLCSSKNLQNELWARPVASKLSEWRPPTLFLGADTENGQKRYFFAFLPITQMQKFSRGIRGCQMKADVLEVQKMW